MCGVVVCVCERERESVFLKVCGVCERERERVFKGGWVCVCVWCVGVCVVVVL